MDRAVRKIETMQSKSLQDELRPFSAYEDATNIVLLGDPGAGKTHTFREFATCGGGRYVKARAFLVTPAVKFDGVLFIDGLDEKRAGRSDRDTVDALVEKLFAVGPGKVRISCRVADWLGDSDLAALRPYFEQSGDPVVLLLGRLSQDEQRELLQVEGLTAKEADAFRGEAAERALGDFLENPQNLIMLLRAVQTGTWPATRKELFELSTRLMLKEFDKDHARAGTGIYSVEELRPAAGAACAARLISDIEAISLADHEESASVPSYRSLSMIEPEKMIAALGRRVFTAGSAPESVDYAHRTTAEYLGAAWLADVVRNGMPFGRLQALMGTDGHPAPELRGLHAWLAVQLPEYADRLIDADPYGVLAYGDASSLSRSSCAHLVKALGRLSQRDPWFRSDHWHSPAIGALSRADMLEEFRAVLRADDAGFGVRSIVVEAVSLGAPMPALKDELADVVVRSQSPFAERLDALIALLRIGPDGKAAAEAAARTLGTETNALRLRVELIRQTYGERSGPADVTTLLKDMTASTSNEAATAILYTLPDDIPLADIPVVLDSLPQASLLTHDGHSSEWEVAHFIDRALIRAWSGITDIVPARALQWLQLRNSYSRGYSRGELGHLRSAILERRDRLTAITDLFFDTLVADSDRWSRLARFREVTLQVVTPAELLTHLKAHMARAPAGSEKELFLFEAAFQMTFSMEKSEAAAQFEALFTLGDNRADLRAVRDASMTCEIPSRYLDRTPPNDTEQTLEELREDFAKNAEAIRNGSQLGRLTWAAKIYFSLFSDSDRKASPKERLVAVLGQENADVAIAGFIAALLRPDVPSLADVIGLSVQHQLRERWRVLAAGLIEQWELNPSLGVFSDDFLKAMLVFDLIYPAHKLVGGVEQMAVPSWKAELMQGQPELVRDAYVSIARAKLTKGEQIVDGLRELMVDDALRPFRGDTALQLLRDFPDADGFRLDELFDGVFATPAAYGKFLVVADQVLTGTVPVGQKQHDKWLAAAYLLAPNLYEAQVACIAAKRPGFVFDLRDRSGYDESLGKQQSYVLALPQLAFLARLTGMYFPEEDFPTGVFGGSTNAWDAAFFCRKLINEISTISSQAASETLGRLEADPKMASYAPYVRHALANQDKRRREMEYDRPDWTSTIKALANGAPATVADLHALLLDQLDDLSARIARENTDIYKSFWNVDSYTRPQKPRPENACRDTLVTLLRPALAPKGITVEPEGHMLADKRADISVAMPGRKILCELKCDYHADLWNAADQQLERFYAHDPEAKGFGVYGVFWFGDKRSSPLPEHPEGVELPKSAAELEQALRLIVPTDRRSRLAVIVIDVSGPPA